MQVRTGRIRLPAQKLLHKRKHRGLLGRLHRVDRIRETRQQVLLLLKGFFLKLLQEEFYSGFSIHSRQGRYDRPAAVEISLLVEIAKLRDSGRTNGRNHSH